MTCGRCSVLPTARAWSICSRLLLRGDIAGALKELRDQYDSGADPAVILSDLAEFTHFVTRVKLVPSVADDLSLSEAERMRGRAFAAQLSMRVLSRTWQMLLKGVAEVQQAGRPIAAAEMVLVRIAYAADLPTPDEVIRSLGDDNAVAGSHAPQGNGGGTAMSHAGAGAATAAPRIDAPRGAPRASASPALSPSARLVEPQPASAALAIGSFEELVALATEKRDLQIKTALERDVRLVRCEDGQLEIALEPSAAKSLVNELSAQAHGLDRPATGWSWFRASPASRRLKAQADARDAELKRGVRGDPLVQAVLERFPGAEIVAVRAARSRIAAGRPQSDSDPPRDDRRQRKVSAWPISWA